VSNKGDSFYGYRIFLDLIQYEYEKEWIEFKENWYNRKEIGEYISALSNIATIYGVPYSYISL